MAIANHLVFGVIIGLGVTGNGQAAAPDAVAEKASRVCGACHGAAGISPAGSDTVPNLAGQKKTYMVNALKAYRSGQGRDNLIMSSMARSLSDQDIDDFAAHFASLRPAP